MAAATIHISRPSFRSLVLCPFLIVLFVVVSVFSLDGHHDAQGCPFTAKNGAIVYNVAGDIFELVGQAVSLDCKLARSSTSNSSDLMWIYYQTEMPSNVTEVVDNHTLRLNLVNVTVNSSGSYRCRMRDSRKGICVADIKVGYPPLEVKNFTCVSTNFKFLVCSWVVPYNPISTTYNLVLNDGIADRKKCNIQTKERLQPSRMKDSSRRRQPWLKEPLQQFCNFSDDNDIPNPLYKRDLTFKFTATNTFGLSNFEFHVDHYARVKPNSPLNVSVTNGIRFIYLTWELSSNLKRFPSGFICKVSYRSQWSDDRNLTSIMTQNNNFKVNLTSLTPFTYYFVSVSCLSAVADFSDETMWSVPTVFEARTLSDVPSSPPTIIPGSFHEHQYMNDRTVVIYFRAIFDQQFNGENVSYIVTAKGLDHFNKIHPVSSNDGSATFKNLSLDEAYEFDLWSSNYKGRSQESSRLIVETSRKLPREPSTLMVVAYSKDVYEVSWTPPFETQDITGYTVFWTESNDRFERNPHGSIHWRASDSHTRRVNVTVSGTRPFSHFGVSTRGPNVAGSLLWNTCIMSYNGTIGKLKKVSIARVTSSSIRVNWSLDCSEKLGIIVGYKVYYCVASNEEFENCTGELTEVFIDGINGNSYEITNGVKPFLRYKVVVSAVTKAGEGEHSNAQFTTTGEAAPSSLVQSVQIINVRNTSFVVKWNAPNVANGMITRYNIYYSSGERQEWRLSYDLSDSLASNIFSHELLISDISPYTNYSVTIDACTRAGCSGRSPSVTVLTDVGVPGAMNPPIARLFNSTCILVQPEMGYDMNGPRDYWEVRAVFVDANNETNEDVQFFNVSSDMLYIPVHCDTTKSDVSVMLQSRMINIKDGEHLFGPWSDYAKSTGYCIVAPSMSLIIGIVVGATAALTVILLSTIFATKRIKVVWYKVQNLNVKLPDGLIDPSKDMSNFANGQKITPKMNSYANLGTIYGPASKPLIDDQRMRNDSGGTNNSTCSTDRLLLQEYGVVKSNWANDSLASINQESVSSMPSTVQTQLSSDSSMDLNSSVPDSPDSVFVNGEHPLKNVVGNHLPVPVQNPNGFNPTLTPIGEFHDGAASRDGTPRHYSRFASYLVPDDIPGVRAAPSGGYVAAPYSKFGEGNETDLFPRTSTPSVTMVDEQLDPPQSYSKFGSVAPVVQQQQPSPMKVNGTDNPRVSMTSQNNVGYSVFGLADGERPPNCDNVPNGFLISPVSSKGYVTAAVLSEKDANGRPSQTTSPVVVAGSSKTKPNDEEVEEVVNDDCIDAENLGGPCSYVDMGSHKRSPSNTSSLTAGYSRMGLSRPTSTCSDGGQYVMANSSLSPSPSKSSSCRTSLDVGRDSIVSTETPSSCNGDVNELKVPNGYASVYRLLADADSNS